MDVTKANRLLVLTSGLGVGGAEHQLKMLMDGLSEEGFELTIVCLSEVVSINFSGDVKIIRLIFNESQDWILFPARLLKLMGIVVKFKPTVILGWMYGGNIFAFFCKLFVPFTPLYIGIRASNMDNRRYKFQKYFNKWISIFASGAIYNSYQGAIYHNSIGFRTSNSHVIFNAIDSNKFRPNRVMSAVVKKSHKIPLGSKVILYPARVDPMKNHDLVLKVAKILPEFNFVFIGRGTELLNTSANCFAVGQVLAPENYYNIADLTLCFSRYGEGFPNVVGESLSCGVAVLAQPVGDVEIILENGGGFLIDSDDPTIVAEEIKTIFQNKRALKNVEMAGRRQVIENFSVRAMVGAYKDLLSQK